MPSAINWVEKLSQVEMPVLSSVVRQLNQLTGNDDTEINQLSEVILKDPHLTSQILKITNSVEYNPIGSPISTVSRAIVVLGFRGVRSLCISLMLIDSLLGNQPKERLLMIMAKAFQAAVQARAIYHRVDDKNDEAVFIAALLYNVGEMAFWAYGGQTAKELSHFTDDNKLIEKKLGITFKMLSRELGKVWNLGEVLQESLSEGNNFSNAAQSVKLGESLSQLAIDDKEGRQRLIKKVAAFTGDSLSKTKVLIETATEDAAVVALDYGANQVCHLIPSQKARADKETDKKIQVLEPDTSLQLKILRDLAKSVSEKVDVNTIFQMALEGMHRGVGLERVALAFFKGHAIVGKYVLGQSTDSWREKFYFDISQSASNLFAQSLQMPMPLWVDEKFIASHPDWYTDNLKLLIGKKPSLIGVLKVNGRNAALFYADRGNTNEPIKTDHFEAFQHFLSQAEMSIQAMADKQIGS